MRVCVGLCVRACLCIRIALFPVQLRPLPALSPMECGAAAAASFALCTGLYGAADACSSRWHPPTYAADKPERRILWNTTAVAVYPGLVVPWLALAGSRQFYAEAGLTMVGPANRWLWLALAQAAPV